MNLDLKRDLLLLLSSPKGVEEERDNSLPPWPCPVNKPHPRGALPSALPWPAPEHSHSQWLKSWLSLDIMLCEGRGTQVKKKPSQSHTTLPQSPHSLPTTLVPFSSSVLFSTSTSNTCIATVPGGPNCLFQHLSTTCCFLLRPKLTVP